MLRAAGVRRRVWLAAGISMLLWAGCESGGTTDPPPGGNPTISIALSGGTLSLAQGANGTVTLTLTRGGGFTGAVNVVVQNAPSGLTATVSPASLGAGVTSATIQLAAGATLAPGTYNLTVRASGTGVQDATASLAATVTAVVAGDFSLALNPGTLSIQQGANQTTTVTVTRSGGFTGAVALTVTGAPTGMTVAADPASVTGNTSTLTVTVGQSVATGSHTLTVRGNATGLSEKTATLTVTVTSGGGGGAGNVTWQFCPLFGIPVWVAAQDGNGGWAQVTAGANNTYTFNLASGRGGIAFVIDGDLSIYFGTVAELNAISDAQCETTATGKTITGSIVNLGATEQATVALGPSSAFVFGALGTNFELEDVPDGPQDLIAARYTAEENGDIPTFTLNKLILRRGLNPPNNSALQPIDFTAAEAFDPVMRNVTLANLGTDLAIVSANITTANSAGVGYLFDFNPSASPDRTYLGLPEDRRIAGDFHFLLVNAFEDTETPTTFRAAALIFGEATDKAITLPPNLTQPTVTQAAATPNRLLRMQYTRQPEFDQFWTITYTQDSGHSVTIFMTAAYLGGADLDFTIPDFSGVSGWSTQYGLQPNEAGEWNLVAFHWTTQGGIIGPPTAAEGEFRFAARSGAF